MCVCVWVQVGGIKEKLLAAHRAGITRVVLPRRNEKVGQCMCRVIRDSVFYHVMNIVTFFTLTL